MLVICNYDLAGTNKCVTHALTEDEKKTICGLVVSKLRGDWQETGGTEFGCLSCRKIIQQTKIIPNKHK